jgi:hypothetical protein
MAAGWSSRLLPARLTMRLWLTLRECSQTHTHTHTQSQSKAARNSIQTQLRHTHINQTLARTHVYFRSLTIAIHPVSLLLSSPQVALLTLGHDLQTETVERTRRSQSQSEM